MLAISVFRLSAISLLCAVSVTAHAGWLDSLKKVIEEVKPPASTATSPAPTLTNAVTAALSDEDVVKGLKEALSKGTQQAIANLGKEGGFLNNLDVKIPMPDELARVEQLMRQLGQDKYADQFVATMNHAAEKAVPEAAIIFSDSISQMTLADAKAILMGPENRPPNSFARPAKPN